MISLLSLLVVALIVCFGVAESETVAEKCLRSKLEESASINLSYESVTACMNDSNDTNDNSCAFKCTIESIGAYWECAKECAANCASLDLAEDCIVLKCPAAVAAFDVPCLKGCGNSTVLAQH